MAYPDSVFTVVEEKNCPFYQTGDQFRLSGNALLAIHGTEKEFVTTSIVKPPEDKRTCLTLVGDLTRILIKYERVSRIPEIRFSCAGCRGVIRLALEKTARPGLPAPRKSKHGELRKIVELLSDFSIFKNLSEQSLFNLVSLLKLKKYPAGKVIIAKGEPGKKLFIVLTGKVEVADEYGNRISVLESGEIFGEMSLISGEAVGANIKSLEPVSVLFIDGLDFIRTLNKYPTLQMYFAQLLAQRLSRANMDRTRDFSLGMIGRLSEMPPAELFQTLHVNQKTGTLTLNFENQSAVMTFRDGGLIRAKFGAKEGAEAFYAVFRHRQGRFKFVPGISPEEKELPEIGFFMKLLMDGVRKVDEESGIDKAR